MTYSHSSHGASRLALYSKMCAIIAYVIIVHNNMPRDNEDAEREVAEDTVKEEVL